MDSLMEACGREGGREGGRGTRGQGLGKRKREICQSMIGGETGTRARA